MEDCEVRTQYMDCSVLKCSLGSVRGDLPADDHADGDGIYLERQFGGHGVTIE